VARRAILEPPTAPDVSVVVICYNDRANLGRAIASVQDQTLRNLEIIVVDDASTDGSADLAEDMAREDARIRVVRLPSNSGGCSAPRNAGLDTARAPYVMFLDSDDYYDRHACKTLLLTAERTGADLVAGQVRRVLVTRRREGGWIKKLYVRRAVYRGIRENPQLFLDPLSTNKLYRRELLDRHHIRFPVGVHYEDSLFSTMAYCRASVIAVVPNVVYFWRVVHDEEEADLSITQRRFEIQNFRDRIAVHRMMDDFLLGNGFADLKAHKDVKFVRHDLRLYLRDVPYRSEDYQREFLRTAADYLATVSAETMALLNPVERICVHMIRRLDLDQALRTVDYLKFGYKLSTRLAERDGRVYWSDRYLDTPEDRAIMDVTEMRLHELPFDRLPLYNEVTAASVVGDRLRLSGRVLNQLGRIPREAAVQLWVSARNRGRYQRRRLRVPHVRHEGDHISYEADLDVARLTAPLDQDDRVWDLRLEVQWHGHVSMTPFSVDPALVAGLRIPVRARLGGVVRGELEPVVTSKMNLALGQVPEDGRVEQAVARTNWLVNKVRLTLLWRTRNTLDHPALKQQAYKLFRRLPLQRGLVVFESHMGKQYSDSPRYIYEAAVAAGLDRLGLTPVWSHARKTPVGFPQDVRLVRRESWRWYWSLARAEFWVDNQGFPRHVTKRRETTYIQTWHGTPLKRMGFDAPQLERANAATKRAHRAAMRRWSALLVPSEYFVETFVASYGYQGRLVRHGLPRNDLLVRGVDEQWRRDMRAELGLPNDRRLVLYAPTFRDRARRLGRDYELPFDLADLQAALSQEMFLLLRTHYLDSYKLSDRYRTFAADVSGHHDVTELMLLADVLVTDYSSVMFDFANTGRPMVFHTYDYEDYTRDERGTYVDLASIAPGPLTRDTEELVDALRRVDEHHAAHRERYAAFRARFCEYETGEAAELVVKEFFEKGRFLDKGRDR